jgi:hypothetical protein
LARSALQPSAAVPHYTGVAVSYAQQGDIDGVLAAVIGIVITQSILGSLATHTQFSSGRMGSLSTGRARRVRQPAWQGISMTFSPLAKSWRA